MDVIAMAQSTAALACQAAAL